jgi:multiple sugar transport system permease protein
MSLVSQVGRKSWGVRLLFGGMYALLLLGALTMVYPFLLMVTMSTTNRADCQEFRIIPRYWLDDGALFKKYLLEAMPSWSQIHAQADLTVTPLATWFGMDHWFTTFDIKISDLDSIIKMPRENCRARARDLWDFIRNACPAEFKMPAFIVDSDSMFFIQDDYVSFLKGKYGSLEEVNRVYGDNAATWDEIGMVIEPAHRALADTPRVRDWRGFIEKRAPERTGLFDADMLVYVATRGLSLPSGYNGSRDKNGIIVRSLITYDDLATGKLGTNVLMKFMRSQALGRYLSVDIVKAESAWKDYLRVNKCDEQMPLKERVPQDEYLAGRWNHFIATVCPLEAISMRRPEDAWRPFLAGRYKSIEDLNKAWGSDYRAFNEVRLPYAAFHYDVFLGIKKELRRSYLVHNFKTVFNFIAIHGSALRVTVIYIILLIAGTLTINPLAAYAMSRFRLQESHHILLFLLATMAFPGEVLMIPNFLQIKSFPIGAFGLVLAAMLLFYFLFRSLRRRLSLLLSATVALVLVGCLAGWFVPRLAEHFQINTSVTLMNTFWALVLPGLANGYGIFLLKGFFDSLPPELYEAGLIDGASEMRMFWQITIPLCKPIMAVMVLGAFGAAYGAFMHAFLICQDPQMWTLMVFLYEFQQNHSVSLVMASLVMAAVPTLLVFVFCQNIILRGIVIPTFK